MPEEEKAQYLEWLNDQKELIRALISKFFIAKGTSVPFFHTTEEIQQIFYNHCQQEVNFHVLYSVLKDASFEERHVVELQKFVWELYTID